jgi:hypothetical protein
LSLLSLLIAHCLQVARILEPRGRYFLIVPDKREPHFKHAPRKIREAVELFRANPGTYLDTHAWQFTPASFKEIASLLFELRMVPLRPVRVFETAFATLEFCAILEKADFPGDGVPAGFDGELYLRANPDVRAAGVDARTHYLEYGRKEGRRLRP